eukprot:TRINITY_DN4691_c0_g1_i1.p1 TRINITY_DN4691_c0_g1~~TRINITY_DN4691_c0_g1_i1.p1  ORF type:complete len:136 (+),score=25.68 TRINITY_DN4691_c0_g1_i1:112-519(+)
MYYTNRRAKASSAIILWGCIMIAVSFIWFESATFWTLLSLGAFVLFVGIILGIAARKQDEGVVVVHQYHPSQQPYTNPDGTPATIYQQPTYYNPGPYAYPPPGTNPPPVYVATNPPLMPVYTNAPYVYPPQTNNS